MYYVLKKYQQTDAGRYLLQAQAASEQATALSASAASTPSTWKPR